MQSKQTYETTEGNISPQTQKQQQAKKEKLAAALRANLRRRKMAGTEKHDGNA